MESLESNYEKIRTVGKGAFGIAVLYRKKQNNKLVVLKEINIGELTSVEKEMALNEVEILSSLSHPNIIAYGGSFEINDTLMIEMEYADGGTLAQMLANREKHLPEREILNLFQQIASAIIHMHENNILHRDLKTANVFLNSDGVVKIGDFGISKILSTNAQAQTVLGTPYYISPEMCEGRDYDEKSDMWAMGCILYEMCCLHRTFQASNLPALVNKIMKGNIKPIPEGYSAKLDQLVKELLNKNPESRPSAIDVYEVFIPDIIQSLGNKGFVYVGSKLNNIHKKFTIKDEKIERSILYKLRYLKDGVDIQPVNLPAKLNIKQVFIGSNHNLVLSNDGSVYAWGNNDKGQLGLGFISANEIDIKIVEEMKNKDIIKVLAGLDFSIFLSKHGEVYSSGAGFYGCLGHGNWNDYNIPTKINFLAFEHVVNMNCGSRHVIALTSTFQLFGWGTNDDGQLGLGNLQKTNVPVQIKLNERISEIYCGFNTTILVDVSERKVWGCGRNTSNQISMSGKNIKTFTRIQKIKAHVQTCSIGNENCAFLLCFENKKSVYITGRNEIAKVFDIQNIFTVKCGPTYIVAGTNENTVIAWGTLEHENVIKMMEDKNSDQSSGVWSHNSETEQKSTFEKTSSKVKLINPTVVLALYSSQTQMSLGNSLRLENIFPTNREIFVLCKTTTPYLASNVKAKPKSIEPKNEATMDNLPQWIRKEIYLSKYAWGEQK